MSVNIVQLKFIELCFLVNIRRRIFKLFGKGDEKLMELINDFVLIIYIIK